MSKLAIYVVLAALSGYCQADLINDSTAELELKVSKGNTEAMCELGNRMIRGRGMDTNRERGKQLVAQSAEQGFIDCQYYLAVMYQDGRWMPLNLDLAYRWFKSAAEKGNPSAQIEMGLLYERGLNNTPKDPTQALGWYKRSALQRHTPGMFQYGRLLLKDNHAEALAWLQIAGEKGDFDAQTLLSEHPITDDALRAAYEKELQKLRTLKP